MPTDNGGVCSNGGTSLHTGLPKLLFAHNRTARINHIGKHTAGTQEDIILASHTRIDRDIILHLHAIPQHNTRRNDHILPDVAPLTDATTLHDVTEMPNAGALSDLTPRIHHRCLIHLIGHTLIPIYI